MSKSAISSLAAFLLLMLIGCSGYFWNKSWKWCNSYTYVTSPDSTPQHLFGLISVDGFIRITWNTFNHPKDIAWMPKKGGGVSLQRYEGCIDTSEKITVNSKWSYFDYSWSGGDVRILGLVSKREKATGKHIFRSVQVPYLICIVYLGVPFALILRKKIQQGGADHPATAPDLNSEGKDKPQPEKEVAPGSGRQA